VNQVVDYPKHRNINKSKKSNPQDIFLKNIGARDHYKPRASDPLNFPTPLGPLGGNVLLTRLYNT
jgi:hypothetical protein